MTKTQLVFAPGCFDDFEGNQEELDKMIAELRALVENGTLMDNLEPVEISDEEFVQMMNAQMAPKTRQ